MTAILEGRPVTEPGVFTIGEAAYHAHPALSSSGARKLLPPSCPALFKWERDHGQAHRAVFDFGHAAHALALGVGAEIVTVDAEDWRTKAAKEARDAAYAEGKTPLLAAERAQVEGMAAALLEHPIASALFDPERGKPEQSLFWMDERHEVWRRARLDWLPDVVNDRIIITDYKTTACAEPRAVAKSMASYGYHAQAAWYVDAVHALGLAEHVGFVLLCQEKTPPYLVTVAEPDQVALRVGRALNDRALEVYADCLAHDYWPGYTDGVEVVSLPAWAIRDFQELIPE